MSHVGQKRGRPKGRVPGSLRWEGDREGIPKTSVWRDRLRAEVIAIHPWLGDHVPWSYRQFERYARALRTWAGEPAHRAQWTRYANARVERWVRDRKSEFIPWTVSRFLCDQLETFASHRGWSPRRPVRGR